MLPRRARIAAVTLAAVASCGALYARRAGRAERAAIEASALAASTARGDLVLRVPHLAGSITLDGDTDDPGWLNPPGPARTGPFRLDDGAPTRPYSEARIVWGGDYLYLALYASDEDIEAHTVEHDGPVADEDAFQLVFSRAGAEYGIDVSPRGIVRDAARRRGGGWDGSWESEAHVSVEIDGTIDAANNLDEEWELEVAIPFASLGMRGEPGENIGFAVRRCDTPKGAPRVCAGWGLGPGERRGRLVLE